ASSRQWEQKSRGMRASFSAMSAGSLRSSKFQRSSSHDGAASTKRPAIGFSTFSSDRYLSRMDPPTECATRITFPRVRDSSEEIFFFQDSTFGSASEGILGKRTSYVEPSALFNESASCASSEYAPLPPP